MVKSVPKNGQHGVSPWSSGEQDISASFGCSELINDQEDPAGAAANHGYPKHKSHLGQPPTNVHHAVGDINKGLTEKKRSVW